MVLQGGWPTSRFRLPGRASRFGRVPEGTATMAHGLPANAYHGCVGGDETSTPLLRAFAECGPAPWAPDRKPRGPGPWPS